MFVADSTMKCYEDFSSALCVMVRPIRYFELSLKEKYNIMQHCLVKSNEISKRAEALLDS